MKKRFLLPIGIFFSVLATLAQLVLPADAASYSKTWEKWCNSSVSQTNYDLYVHAYGKTYDIAPGVCFSFVSGADNDSAQVNPDGGSHEIAYNYGSYSAWRTTPSGYFTPADKAVIYFKLRAAGAGGTATPAGATGLVAQAVPAKSSGIGLVNYTSHTFYTSKGSVARYHTRFGLTKSSWVEGHHKFKVAIFGTSNYSKCLKANQKYIVGKTRSQLGAAGQLIVKDC